MRYGKSFFALQLEFAEAVSALSGLPLAQTVLDYTNVYIRLGLGHDFDAGRPRWQAYLAGLREASDRAEWTHRFYATQPDSGPPGVGAAFGCFSYSRLGSDHIRLHFSTGDGGRESPLSRARRDERRADLAALFGDVKRTLPDSTRVVGRSWLYNLAAYRRLFPESYLATARETPGRFRHMPLWGQFLDRTGHTREPMADEFRRRLRQQSSLQGLEGCFPLQVLSLEAPARDFYGFYGV